MQVQPEYLIAGLVVFAGQLQRLPEDILII